jgi:hypothetical protein
MATTTETWLLLLRFPFTILQLNPYDSPGTSPVTRDPGSAGFAWYIQKGIPYCLIIYL